MLRTLLPAALLLFALPAPTSARLRLPLTSACDYSTVPSSPAEISALLGKCEVGLARAAEVAAKAAGGVVGSVQLSGNAEAPVFDVLVFAGGKTHRVQVDAKSGEVKSQVDMPRFPGDPVEGDWVELPSGLKYFEIRPGTGEKPPSPSTKVKVHYSGWLLDGTQFDSSYKRNEPATFPLNGVIKGWTEGVGSMQVGGKRKLVIPSSLAYGDQGRPSIPGKATLVFDVELLEIVP